MPLPCLYLHFSVYLPDDGKNEMCLISDNVRNGALYEWNDRMSCDECQQGLRHGLLVGGGRGTILRPSTCVSFKPRVPPNPVFPSDLGHLFFVIALARLFFLGKKKNGRPRDSATELRLRDGGVSQIKDGYKNSEWPAGRPPNKC